MRRLKEREGHRQREGRAIGQAGRQPISRREQVQICEDEHAVAYGEGYQRAADQQAAARDDDRDRDPRQAILALEQPHPQGHGDQIVAMNERHAKRPRPDDRDRGERHRRAEGEPRPRAPEAPAVSRAGAPRRAQDHPGGADALPDGQRRRLAQARDLEGLRGHQNHGETSADDQPPARPGASDQEVSHVGREVRDRQRQGTGDHQKGRREHRQSERQERVSREHHLRPRASTARDRSRDRSARGQRAQPDLP